MKRLSILTVASASICSLTLLSAYQIGYLAHAEDFVEDSIEDSVEEATGAESMEDTTVEWVEPSFTDDLVVAYEVSEDKTSVTYTFDCTVKDYSFFDGFFISKVDPEDENYKVALEVEPFDGYSNVLSRSYTFTENGSYRVRITAFDYAATIVDITVDSIVPQVVMQDDFVDNTAPEIYLDVPDVSGLTQGDIFNFGVSTNEECTIRVGTDVFNNTTQATGTAYGNGSIDVVAVDSWGNMSTAVVNITAFGDGSISPPRKSHKNDNPLTKVDKESYWGLAAMGSLDGATGDGSSSSSDKITKLPQTGVATAGIFAGLTALAGVGAVLMVKFRKGKKGVVSDEE